MPANFGQRPPPPAGGALLGLGTAGAGSGALASVAMYLRPGYPAGIATTVADLLILMGIIGLGRRERSTDWHPVAICALANVIAATAALVLPRVGVGPVSDFFGSLSWLADGAAYGALGWVLLRRRTNIHMGLGIVTGTACAMRAGLALLLAGLQPLEITLGLPDFLLLHLWQVASVAVGGTMAVFFIIARSTQPAHSVHR